MAVRQSVYVLFIVIFLYGRPEVAQANDPIRPSCEMSIRTDRPVARTLSPFEDPFLYANNFRENFKNQKLAILTPEHLNTLEAIEVELQHRMNSQNLSVWRKDYESWKYTPTLKGALILTKKAVNLFTRTSDLSQISISDKFWGAFFEAGNIMYYGPYNWIDRLLKNGIVPYPTHFELSKKTLNRWFAAGILPMGVVFQPTRADGYFMTPRFFLVHEIYHAWRTQFFKTHIKNRNISDSDWIYFFNQVDQLTNAELAYAIEDVLFIVGHELTWDPDKIPEWLNIQSRRSRVRKQLKVIEDIPARYRSDDFERAMDWVADHFPSTTSVTRQ